jgi:hypothetical protein
MNIFKIKILDILNLMAKHINHIMMSMNFIFGFSLEIHISQLHCQIVMIFVLLGFLSGGLWCAWEI